MKRWPLHNAYFWEKAPFFRILLPFVAGIIFYEYAGFGALKAGVSLSVIGIAFLCFAAIIAAKKSNGLYKVVLFSLLNIMLFFSGHLVSYYNDIRNSKTWFGSAENIGKPCLARINDMPAEKEHSWKVPVTMLCYVNDGKVNPVSGNAFLYLYKDGEPMMLHKGDSIWAPGKWQPIKNAGNPFEFDYPGYCRQNNLFYQQSCSINDIRLYASGDPAGMPLIERSHDWSMAQLDKYITDPKTKGLIQAMLLGDEVNLDEDLRQSYSETGIVHIIAISGGNVAIFFFVISALLWWLKDRRHLWVKYAIALPLVWFYVIMAGAAPSAIRAAIMFSLLAFAVMLQKNNNSLNQLFATAFLLLCAQPMWLFSAGFQLSFVAVLSLILFYTPVYKWLSPTKKITRLLWGAVAASIAAEMLVSPLVIYYFHNFPLLFLIANVAAYLFMSIVLVLGIAIIVLSFIPAVAKALGICTVSLVTVFDKIVGWLQSCNPESFHFLSLSTQELVMIYAAITGIVLFLLKKQKPALFMGLGVLCVLLLSFCKDEWKRLHQERLVVYNVGKANHIELINGDTYSIVCTDTGAAKKTAYAVKPAHTKWGAWKKDTNTTNEIFYICGKTALLLSQDINTSQQFPVDYLIINYTGSQDAVKLKQLFAPKLVILGTQYSQKQQNRIVNDFAAAGINVHAIGRDGAFVLSGL